MIARLRNLPAAPVTWDREADVVIVGAGVAGLAAALEAAAAGRRVLLVCKAGLDAGSSPLAQGGLAAVLGGGATGDTGAGDTGAGDPGAGDTGAGDTGPDSPGLHARDTLAAGAGLCDDAAVRVLVAAAPGEIRWLAGLGARFDGGPPGLEGGHSRPRIVHAGGDASGAEVHRALRDAVLAEPGIEVLAAVALDALTDERGQVTGLLAGALDGARGRRGDLAAGTIRAAAVVLASGGYGQAYATTTNPAGATGDGLALAARAGAALAGLEFMQFHPTVLWQPGGRGQRPLVTEALRGAGAVIVDAAGQPVMAGRDLAPRDVVAARMHRVMTATGTDHLWLDATAVGRAGLERRFPTVTAACRAAGIEPSREPIPIAPGAHYACGGVRADMSGRTGVPGLYAVGEVAATGVHGANRLASNSLTEAIIAGRRLGRLLGRRDRGQRAGPGAPPPPGAGAAPGGRDGLAAAMSRYAGVLRDQAGLERLLGLLAEAPGANSLDLATAEATSLHVVSSMVAAAALARAESRGCHRRSDAESADVAGGTGRRTALVVRGGEIRVSPETPAGRETPVIAQVPA